MANNKWRIKEAVKIAEDAALKALRTEQRLYSQRLLMKHP